MFLDVESVTAVGWSQWEYGFPAYQTKVVGPLHRIRRERIR